VIKFLLELIGVPISPTNYLGPHELVVPEITYDAPPPQGRIPFIGWLDLAEINDKMNHTPTEEGFEMIPSGYTADCGDEAYVESYTDEAGNRSNSNLTGWYPIPEGTLEKWRVVGRPCMRMARRKTT